MKLVNSKPLNKLNYRKKKKRKKNRRLNRLMTLVKINSLKKTSLWLWNIVNVQEKRLLRHLINIMMIKSMLFLIFKEFDHFINIQTY